MNVREKLEIPRTQIQEYLKIIIKRRFFFIILSFSIMSVMVWGSYSLPKQYEASSTVFIESNVIKNLVGGIAITPSMGDRIRVLKYAMLSRGLILEVIKELDIDTQVKSDKKLEEMISNFQRSTIINLKGNELFIVSIRDTNPKLAMDYVNTLVRKYVEENISAKREEAYGASRFLEEQIALLKQKVDKAEQEITEFRQKRGIYISVNEKSLIEEIKKYTGEIENIEVRKKELVATKDSIKRQLDGEEPFTVAILSFKRPESSDNTITTLENRVKQLLIRYTDNYPEIIKLRVEIEALKKQQAMQVNSEVDNTAEPELSTANPIYQELKQKYLQLESEISALDAKKKQLMAMINERKGDLRNLPAEKKQLAQLERARETNRELYEYLLTRLGQSEVSKQMEIADKATTFRIVDPAVLPTKPVNSRVKFIFAGIVFGFIGGFGGVLLREQFDSSIKETGTLRDLGLEVLAVIPKIFNEVEYRKRMIKERVIYAVAVFYFLIICSSLVLEIMGLTYIDTLISTLNLGALKDNIVHATNRILWRRGHE
ncbi:MAG TPA: XrtA system polysaccharide chain length determinant [Thermodesulfovibrionales bacterium]|nr:XrtA system polysaccharide chain length determinant [Thermodesulfovibrionales bacterium]